MYAMSDEHMHLAGLEDLFQTLPQTLVLRDGQSGLNGIAQTVLGGLIDDVERLKGLHTGQRLSIGASRRKTHGKVGFALAGVALYDGQLSEWDIRKP